ncbi:RHS repeat-associated core domain-containing protein [Chloroflexota bacterium]
MHDCGVRYYGHYLNRFVGADTIIPNPGNPQDFNRYSYTRNNPLIYTDPTGHVNEMGAGGGGSSDTCKVIVGAKKISALGTWELNPYHHAFIFDQNWPGKNFNGKDDDTN